MGLFRPRKETSGSIDLTDQTKDASRSRFSFHRRARDESTTRITLGSPSEAAPMTQRVFRVSPQSREEASDIRSPLRSGLFKSRSDSNETGHKDANAHHFSNKRSEPAIPNLSRSKSPPQVSERGRDGRIPDKDAAAHSSPKHPQADHKTPVSSASSSTESAVNLSSTPMQTSVIKANGDSRSSVSQVSAPGPAKEEKAGKRWMNESKSSPLRPATSPNHLGTHQSMKRGEIVGDGSPASASSLCTSVPALQTESSTERDRRRLLPAKSVSQSPPSPRGHHKSTAVDDRPHTPPASPTITPSAVASGTASAGGGILKRSALKSPPRPQLKVANSPALSSPVSPKTEEPSVAPQSEFSAIEPTTDTDIILPSSPSSTNSKAPSSSTHIRRISLNDCDRPSPKATARKATFAPSVLRTQALRSTQADTTPQSSPPCKPKTTSATTNGEPILDFSPSDSSTQATPTDEGNPPAEPPALSKILKSSYAFDADRRGNLGSPFACPGFDNEGSANELLKALTMRRMKTIKMEKSWAGVGAQDDDSEEELPSSRVKIIPRKGQL